VIHSVSSISYIVESLGWKIGRVEVLLIDGQQRETLISIKIQAGFIFAVL
jgi:precorrin-6B methylase 1